MGQNQNTEAVKKAWGHLGAGEMDELAKLYADDMVFVLPGQNDIIVGKSKFRSALNDIGQALPPGFEVLNLAYFEGDSDVVNVVKWKSNSIPNATQSTILWRFDDHGKIIEERWFVDTEQWRAAFREER